MNAHSAVALATLFGLLLMSAETEAASARLSADEILEYETVQLELFGSPDTSPDLAPLEEDFEILGRSSQSSMQIVNGRIEVSENSVRLTIRPRRTGRLVVPPIAFGDEQTQSLVLNVKPLDANVQKDVDELAFFEVLVSNQRPYQGEAVFLTRRLFYAQEVQIYGSLPGIPEVAGATVQPLGEPTSTQSIRNGRRYNIFDSEYVLFADESGALSIPAVEVMARMRLAGPAQGRSLGIPVRSQALSLEIRPPPDVYPAGKPWLPARGVSVESDFNTQSVEVGVPLSFHVKVFVQAALASQVAPLHLAFPASIKSYPESPRLEDTLESGSVRGVRTERYSLVPTQPGILTLPEVRVAWWDTQNQRLREATLPGRELEVLPNPEMAAAAQQPQPAVTLTERAAPNFRTTQAAGGWSLDWLDALLTLLCLTLGGGWLLSTHPEWRRASFFVRTTHGEKSAESSAFQRVKATQSQADLLARLRIWLPFVSTRDDAYLDCERLVRRAEAALYADDASRPAEPPSVRELHQAATRLRQAWLQNTKRARGSPLPGLYSRQATSP